MSRFVIFKSADSIDVYLRSDDGHGRVEYTLVATIVVAEPPPAPSGRWSRLWSLLDVILSVFG